MTTIRPPRWAQRLLEATGADPDFQDAVLGDLVEEFEIRLAYDGERSAGRWYAREALRTLPHLVRDWWGRARHPEAAYLAKVVSKAYVTVALAAGGLLVITSSALAMLGIDLGAQRFPAAGPLVRHLGLPGMFIIGTVCAVFGGYVAARWGRRAPLASAVGLGLFWCMLASAAVVGMFLVGVPNTTPLSWMIGEPLLVVFSTTAGGLIRICSSDAHSPAGVHG